MTIFWETTATLGAKKVSHEKNKFFGGLATAEAFLLLFHHQSPTVASNFVFGLQSVWLNYAVKYDCLEQ